MKVKELIAALEQEDLEAVVLVVPKRFNQLTLRTLRYENERPPIFNVEFGGNEREFIPKVILIAEQDYL